MAIYQNYLDNYNLLYRLAIDEGLPDCWLNNHEIDLNKLLNLKEKVKNLSFYFSTHRPPYQLKEDPSILIGMVKEELASLEQAAKGVNLAARYAAPLTKGYQPSTLSNRQISQLNSAYSAGYQANYTSSTSYQPQNSYSYPSNPVVSSPQMQLPNTTQSSIPSNVTSQQSNYTPPQNSAFTSNNVNSTAQSSVPSNVTSQQSSYATPQNSTSTSNNVNNTASQDSDYYKRIDEWIAYVNEQINEVYNPGFIQGLRTILTTLQYMRGLSFDQVKKYKNNKAYLPSKSVFRSTVNAPAGNTPQGWQRDIVSLYKLNQELEKAYTDNLTPLPEFTPVQPVQKIATYVYTNNGVSQTFSSTGQNTTTDPGTSFLGYDEHGNPTWDATRVRYAKNSAI